MLSFLTYSLVFGSGLVLFQISFMWKMGEKLDKVELVKKLQKGLIPDEEVRTLIREQLKKRLQWGYKATHEEQLSHLVCFAISLRKMGLFEEMANDQNKLYEVPLSFLQLVHGEKLTQSAFYFEGESTTLDEAELAMLELYCERSQIKDGQRVLDLGCGFGALTLYIAQKYEHCQVTAITNSKIQKDFILERCRHYKLSNVEILVEDITTFETKCTFDRVLAIGLIEHMKNYNLLLQKISQWMSKDGLLFINHVCHKTFAYQYEPVDDDDWVTNYAFSKEAMLIPSASFLLYFQDDIYVVGHWTISGKHFSRTNEEWLKRIDANHDVLGEIVEPVTKSKEEAAKLINYWRHLCIIASEMFGYANGEEWMNSLVLLKKR